MTRLPPYNAEASPALYLIERIFVFIRSRQIAAKRRGGAA
jgi:hypothetical protein